jgi:uncharacterized zinc-type alcohol dehydrogenase-like protein
MGGIRQPQEMLVFYASQGLGAEVEVTPATRINAAYHRVVAGDVRYRFVIDVQTF